MDVEETSRGWVNVMRREAKRIVKSSKTWATIVAFTAIVYILFAVRLIGVWIVFELERQFAAVRICGNTADDTSVCGSLELLDRSHAKIFFYQRTYGQKRAVIILNLSKKDIRQALFESQLSLLTREAPLVHDYVDAARVADGALSICRSKRLYGWERS